MIINRHQDKRTPKENEDRNAACKENGAGKGYGQGRVQPKYFEKKGDFEKRKVNEKSGPSPSREKRKAAKEKKRKGQ